MSGQETDSTVPRLPQSVLIVYFLVIGALWSSVFFPETRLWGVNWYRYFSWYGPVILLLVGLGAPLVVLRRRQPLGTDSTTTAGRGRFVAGAVTIVALFSASFLLLRGRTHFLGDGYQVLAKVQAGPEVIKPWDRITWSLQKAVYQLLGGSGESAALVSLQMLSVVCGLLFLAAAIVTSVRLFENHRTRLLFVLSLASGGYMLLFFGYTENYPPFVLAVAFFGLSGLLVARGYWPRGIILIPLTLALLLHPFGTALIPAALYLLGRGTRLVRRMAGLPSHARFARFGSFAVVAVLAVWYLWNNSYFFRLSLVPPLTDQFTVEGYTLFSRSHLLDYLNLLFMLFPGFPLALAVIWQLPVRLIFGRPEYRFLALLGGVALIITFVFNPRLGMPRDWDLFCFVGLPLAMLVTLLLLDRPGRVRLSRRASALSILLGFLVLGPRLVSQAMPETSIAVFDYFADLDVVKSRNGRFLLQEYLLRHGRRDEHDHRARINAAALPHEQLTETGGRLGEEGRWLEAIAKFRYALSYDPAYPYAWANLGVVYHRMGRSDSALTCLRIAEGLNPYSFSVYMKLAGAYHGKGDLDRAEEYWNRAARLRADDFECRGYLLRLYREQGRIRKYHDLLKTLITRTGVPVEIVEQAARAALDSGDYRTAAARYRQALQNGLDSQVVRDLQQQYPQLQIIGLGPGN